MTAPLTLPAVTAALVRAGVQTVASVAEEPTMECPEYDGAWRYGPNCPHCGGSGRVPLSGDVEIRADDDIGEVPDGWWTVLLGLDIAELGITTHGHEDEGLPIILDAPVARATAQCVPVVQYTITGPRAQPPMFPCLDLSSPERPVCWWHHDGGFRDLTDQRSFLDLAAPWALILSDVRPVEDR